MIVIAELSPFQIQSHLALLEMLPEGSQAHNHIRRVLNGVAGLGGGPAANDEANNGHDTEPTGTASPSTSAAPISTRTRGQRALASPSTSAARGRGRPAIASPSTSAARGRGMPATASRSRSVARAVVCLLQQAQAQVQAGALVGMQQPLGL